MTTKGEYLQKKVDYILDNIEARFKPIIRRLVKHIARNLYDDLEEILDTEIQYIKLSEDEVQEIYNQYITYNDLYEIGRKIREEWKEDASQENIVLHYVMSWLRENKPALKDLIAVQLLDD